MRAETSIPAAPTALPVADARRDRLFIAHDGAPVWPMADEAARRSMERLATLCGGVLVQRGEGDAKPAGRKGIGAATGGVAAVERCDVAAARLYGHLTGRTFVGILDCDDATAADVAVGRFGAWSNRVMLWATRPRRDGRQPGLILGRDADSLLRQVVLRSAARHWMAGTRAAVRRLVVACDVSAGAIRDDDDWLFGGECEAADLEEALAARSDILTLAVHSDGIDAKLSANRTLCSRLSHGTDDTASPLLRCAHTDICHRTGMPIEAAKIAGRLVAHDRLSAPVIVLDACSILPTNTRLAPTAQSLGARIVEDCASAAVLLNAEMFTADLRRTIGLSVALGSGRTVGEATAAFNAPAADRTSRRLVLIGDPDIRFASTPGHPARPAATAARPSPAVPAHGSDAVFARILHSAYAASDDDEPGDAWHNAIAAAEAMNAAATSLDLQGWRPPLRRAADCHIDRVVARPTMFLPGLWLPQAVLVDAEEAMSCTACGTAMNAAAASFPSGATGRLFAICPHCAAFQDGPVGARLDFFAPNERGFMLSAEWRGLPAKAVLFSHAPYPEGRRQWLWPHGRDGRLAETFVPPDTPDAPPWMMGILVTWGLQAASALIPVSGTRVSAP